MRDVRVERQVTRHCLACHPGSFVWRSKFRPIRKHDDLWFPFNLELFIGDVAKLSILIAPQ
jgi:hypothetical protein